MSNNEKPKLPILQTSPERQKVRLTRSKSSLSSNVISKLPHTKLKSSSRKSQQILSKTMATMPNLPTEESTLYKSRSSFTPENLSFDTTQERPPNISYDREHGMDSSSRSLQSEDNLAYQLPRFESLRQSQQYKLLEILASYSYTVASLGQTETVRGVCKVDIHGTGYFTDPVLMVISSHAVYILDYEDLLVNRRNTYQEIQLIGMSKDNSSCILHIIKKNVNSDILLNSGRVEHIIRCIQVSAKESTGNYIPFYSVPNQNALEKRFNRLKPTFIQKFQIPEMRASMELLCSEGSIGDNVICIKRTSRKTHLFGAQDIIAVLTEKTLYALRLDYSILQKIKLNMIDVMYRIEDDGRVLIPDEHTENSIWVLPDTFVENLRRTVLEQYRKKLEIKSTNDKEANRILSVRPTTNPNSVSMPESSFGSASSAMIKRISFLEATRKGSISSTLPKFPREIPNQRLSSSTRRKSVECIQ
jgi:hypothetical protein